MIELNRKLWIGALAFLSDDGTVCTVPTYGVSEDLPDRISRLPGAVAHAVVRLPDKIDFEAAQAIGMVPGHLLNDQTAGLRAEFQETTEKARVYNQHVLNGLQSEHKQAIDKLQIDHQWTLNELQRRIDESDQNGVALANEAQRLREKLRRLEQKRDNDRRVAKAQR